MSIVIAVEDEATLLKGIEALGGQLTATIIGDENELSKAGELLDLLTRKAGGYCLTVSRQGGGIGCYGTWWSFPCNQ